MIHQCTWNDKLRFTAEADDHKVEMNTQRPLGSDSAMTPYSLQRSAPCFQNQRRTRCRESDGGCYSFTNQILERQRDAFKSGAYFLLSRIEWGKYR